MGSTGWHLFGIAHVKVDFIPLQKMHVNPKLEELFLNYVGVPRYVVHLRLEDTYRG